MCWSVKSNPFCLRVHSNYRSAHSIPYSYTLCRLNLHLNESRQTHSLDCLSERENGRAKGFWRGRLFRAVQQRLDALPCQPLERRAANDQLHRRESRNAGGGFGTGRRTQGFPARQLREEREAIVGARWRIAEKGRSTLTGVVRK